MEVKPGYKQTEVGVIPEDWSVRQLWMLVTSGPKNGYSGRSSKEARGTPTLMLTATTAGELVLNDQTVKRLDETINSRSDIFLKAGDVLVQRSNTLDRVGTTAIFDGPDDEYVYPDLMMRLRFRDQETAHWFWRYANSSGGRRFFVGAAAGSTGTMPKLSGFSLRNMPLPFPSAPEQRAIANVLSDVDSTLNGLNRLIAKKRDLKQAAMQQLLTGQTRLPGFGGDWEEKRLSEVATQTTERNRWSENLPVLTCSKHRGFLDSLTFFRNQVFSQDLSSYKIIHYGEIGYPANHVEEGSIGLQNLYDVAIVSPIYVTFRVDRNTNSYFLHRLLKLDSYRQKFRAATTSSIDRRGSLRWPAFSELPVRLPPSLDEQTAISEVLKDVDAEILSLEQRREKTHFLKQAMMQELLTGKTRLI